MKILQAFTILFFSILLGFNNKAHAVTDWNMPVNTIGNIGWTVIPFLIFTILALLFLGNPDVLYHQSNFPYTNRKDAFNMPFNICPFNRHYYVFSYTPPKTAGYKLNFSGYWRLNG